AMQHRFEAPFGDFALEVRHQGSVLMKRVNRPLVSELLRNTFARAGAAKRNDCQRNWNPLFDCAIHPLQVLGKREEGRIIITNTELHIRSSQLSSRAAGIAEAPRPSAGLTQP